jgi:hypothetical protein
MIETLLNGPRDLSRIRHDHHHSLAHVGVADVRSEPPTRAALSFLGTNFQ